MPEKICDEFSAFYPMGTNVLVAKDPDQAKTAGGILIPEEHRQYRRRGWCLVPGPGVRVRNGDIVPPKYKPGDYLIFDRHYVRPDDREEEVYRDDDQVVTVIKGEEIVAFWPAEDRPAPDWVDKLICAFECQPALR